MPLHSKQPPNALAPVAGVILAAGLGRRMGLGTGGQTRTPKQLLPFKGRPLLDHVIHQAKASQLAPICLVLGHRAAEIQAGVETSGVEVIVNTAYESGQASSLIAGLNTVASRCGAVMFLLGDQPLISTGLIDHLIQAHQRLGTTITQPTYQSQRGNPVIIAKPLFPELQQLRGDTGARALFARHPVEISQIPVDDPSILMDVDDPDDYARLGRNNETTQREGPNDR